MKVKNLNPYFGAACERHVVRGCGDESHLFGMLPPRAWTEAQKVFRRNADDLPPGWVGEQSQHAPPRPEGPQNITYGPWHSPLPRLIAALAVLNIVFAGGFVFGLASRPLPPQPVTVLQIGATTVRARGPVTIHDAASGQRFEVSAGASFALPDLDAK